MNHVEDVRSPGGQQSRDYLAKTIVDNYHLTEGDELHLMETEEGVVLTPFNPSSQSGQKPMSGQIANTRMCSRLSPNNGCLLHPR